ncbi:MAG: DeoR/GlpR transcriptional regulator [Alphaproteobacteria bacterium]|nr:DeoR/GlpR transcriptional regulator [Alphaproteobacteria bacterium]
MTETMTKRVEIIPAKRRALILEHLRVNGAASIQELAEAIGGSQSTIRRDLEHLTEAGYLERTHGGALLVPPMRATFEGESSLNAHLQRAEKQAIGIEAARRISPRESVIFDSSSTVLEAVRAAAQEAMPLTAVTNSLEIALLGSTVSNWKVIVPGGTIRHNSTHLTGEPGEEFFKQIHADIFMTGSHSVTGGQLADASLEVASLKRAMMTSAGRRILLVDSSKFRPPAFCVFGDLTQITEVITDDGISDEHLAELRSFDLKVTVVPVSSAANIADQG